MAITWPILNQSWIVLDHSIEHLYSYQLIPRLHILGISLRSCTQKKNARFLKIISESSKCPQNEASHQNKPTLEANNCCCFCCSLSMLLWLLSTLSKSPLPPQQSSRPGDGPSFVAIFSQAVEENFWNGDGTKTHTERDGFFPVGGQEKQ